MEKKMPPPPQPPAQAGSSHQDEEEPHGSGSVIDLTLSSGATTPSPRESETHGEGSHGVPVIDLTRSSPAIIYPRPGSSMQCSSTSSGNWPETQWDDRLKDLSSDALLIRPDDSSESVKDPSTAVSLEFLRPHEGKSKVHQPGDVDEYVNLLYDQSSESEIEGMVRQQLPEIGDGPAQIILECAPSQQQESSEQQETSEPQEAAESTQEEDVEQAPSSSMKEPLMKKPRREPQP